MDNIDCYRNLIKEYITEYAAIVRRQPTEGIETLTLFDETNDQYSIIDVGWNQGKRKRVIFLLVRIKNGKVWIEDDWTQDGLGNILVEAGVPKEDIVLAFLSPREREMSEFAIA